MQDKERGTIIAEAIMASRLRKMVRVDENRYVDNSLITHAEYQLFLNEMYSQGKYYQPDHWLTFDFPAGEGQKPVVGVRSSDAIAFCQWLTKREGGDWIYRLPLPDEIEKNVPITLFGYWVGTETKRGYEGSVDRQFFLNKETFLGILARDLALTSDIARAHALAIDPDRALDTALNIDLNPTRDLARARESALEAAHERALDYARKLSRDFARTLDIDRDLPHTRDIVRDSTLDRALILVRAHARDQDLKHALASARNFTRDRELTGVRYRAYSSTLEVVRDLAIDRIYSREKGTREIVNQQEIRGFLRWYIRVLALFHVGNLLDILNTPSLRWNGVIKQRDERVRKPNELLLPIAMESFDLLMDFAILELRVRGELPAFEGIRIVKERKEQ